MRLNKLYINSCYLRHWHKVKNIKSKKGFTLIELLVVISIISLLASVVFASLGSARGKARDARRMVDVQQLMTALELYYNSNGQYPLSGGATASPPGGSWSISNDGSWTTLGTTMSAYMSKLPIDPKQDPSGGWAVTGNFNYTFFSRDYGCSQQWYMVVYLLENAKGPDPGVWTCDGTLFRYGGAGANTSIKTVGAGR